MSGQEIKVWDPLVRIFHWSLVLAFFIAYVTEDDVMWLHELAGYTVLGLVAFRVIWGVVGTRYARFTNFVRGPGAVSHYIKTYFDKDAPRYIGHNPVGGWMIIAMLVMLALTAWTGIEAQGGDTSQALNGIPFIESAHANGDESKKSGGSEFWEEVHEVVANLSLLLVLAHIAGVLLHSLIHGENLIRAMWNGRKSE